MTRITSFGAALALATAALLALPLVAASAQSAPSWAHPAGATTGIAGVDAAIRAIETRDAVALQSQFLFTPTPCTEPGIGEVKCPEGQPIGTPVEVFLSGCGEGVFHTADSPHLATVAAAMTQTDRYLFAVGRISDHPLGATHVLFFGSANDPGTLGFRSDVVPAVMVFADTAGVRAVNTGCGGPVAQRVRDLAPAGFALAPRSGDPGPPGAGSGMVTINAREPWHAWQPIALFGLVLVAGVMAAALRGRRP